MMISDDKYYFLVTVEKKFLAAFSWLKKFALTARKRIYCGKEVFSVYQQKFSRH